MFAHAATSPYDAFFTSGLLSAARTRFPHSESPTSPDVPLSPRRGSLPDNYPLYSPINDDDAEYDDENDDVFNFYDADADEAMYFTLQPRAKPSAENLRSFLSLDLAESQSMRSASLRRKPSTSTARSNWSRSTLSRQSKSTKAYSGFRFPETIPELPSRPNNALPQPPHSAPIASTSKIPTPPLILTLPSMTTTAAAAAANNTRRPSTTSLRMRFSRDSLRTIPSPKPAPCISLPEPPKSSRAGTPVSVHAPGTVAATASPAAPTPAAVSVPAPAPASTVRAPTPIMTTSTSPASEDTSAQAPPRTPAKTKAPPPRLPSLPPIPLELNIRMSALFASPPKPSSSKPATKTTLADKRMSIARPPPPPVFVKPTARASLAKAPSLASSRFISPASRNLDSRSRESSRKNRESVLTATTTRTVSTRARRWNRSEALARLEGRSPVSPGDGAASPAPATTATGASASGVQPSAAALTAAKLAMRMSASRNFMSMSDDEDEDDESDGAQLDRAKVLEEEEGEDSGGEMVFLRQVAEDSDEDADADADEDLDFDDGCSSSSSSSSGSASSYVSLDMSGAGAPPAAAGASASAARGTQTNSNSSSGSGLSFPSLRGLVGRMAGLNLNPFMEAEDVVLPVQTPPVRSALPSPTADVDGGDADVDVDIDDNFRFPAPPRTTAAERRLSLALSYGTTNSRGAFDGEDGDGDTLSVFDTLFLEAPRSAPLPPPPPPYSPFAQSTSFYSPYSGSALPSPTTTSHHHTRQKKDKKSSTHLAVPVPGPSTRSSSSLLLPGLRRKRTKTRRGRDADEGLVSFIDFPERDSVSLPASAPPFPFRIGERSDSLPEEMRELRRQQRRARYERDEGVKEEGKRSQRGSKDSSKEGSSGSKSSSWTWRSFIEVANV